MINSYPGFIHPESAKRRARMFHVSRELKAKYPNDAEYKKALKEWEARRPKTFRQFLPYLPGIFLRTTLVMTAAVTVIVVLGALGLPWAAHFWFQFAVYLAFYLVFQRFIMGPLAPPKV